MRSMFRKQPIPMTFIEESEVPKVKRKKKTHGLKLTENKNFHRFLLLFKN